MGFRFIYFDCMDTLIQMDIDSLDVYAEWAYQSAEELGIWEDKDRFLCDWRDHREEFRSRHGELKEGTIRGRIRDLLRRQAERRTLGWGPARIEKEVEAVHRSYWQRYKMASFVLPEVPETLARIQRNWEVPLGVVSNFMVEGGIPALLSEHGLDRFFQVLLVSCDHGFKKPSQTIYEAAIRAAGEAPEEILFVGDNPDADYHGPRGMGMAALLYDRRGLQPQVEHRVESFAEIERWL